jgi:hypothetical protein
VPHNNSQDQLINLQAQQLAAQVANWAAQLDFQKARFNQLELPEWQQKSQLEVDQFAWQKAQDTWENAYKEALVTGTYQGQPTIDWLTRQAQLTGVLNGQQTLQGRLTDAQIAQMNQQMQLANNQFMASAGGYMPDGTPTFDREQWMANTTGRLPNGDPTFAREQWQATQAITGWQFLSSLSGPQNAFKQARAIASMPAGLSQMMGAWAGTNMTPGSTAVGSGAGGSPLGDMMLGAAGDNSQSGNVNPLVAAGGSAAGANTTPASLDYSLVPQRPEYWTDQPPRQGVAGEKYTFSELTNAPLSAQPYVPTVITPAAGAPYTYSPPGVQAPVHAWNYTPTNGGNTQVYPPGVASPPETPDYSTTVPQSPGTVADMLAQSSGGRYNYGNPTPPAPTGYTPVMAMPTAGVANPGALLPNQINAENYRNMYDYQKQLGWAAFEDAGWDKGLAQDAFKKSLPTYVNPLQGKIAAF